MNSLPKLILLVLFLVALGSVIYFLWQRQPQVKTKPQDETTKNQEEKLLTSEIEPRNGAVLTSGEVEIEGTAKPSQLVLVYSNSDQKMLNADSAGKFKQKMNLTENLNLIKVIYFKDQNKVEIEKNLSYYILPKNSKSNAKNVVAGSVKSIFENILTVSTSDFETKVTIDKSTQIESPKDEEKESAGTGIDLFRVGDFVIALTSEPKDEDTKGLSLQIIRNNKPTLAKTLISADTASAPRENIFSVKNSKDNKLVELLITKTTSVSIAGKTAKPEDIAKSKKAIILYQPDEDENPVDMIYIFP